MSTYYSDHYSTGVAQTSLPATVVNPDAGIAHGRVRYRRAQVSAMALTTDTVRMFTMRSSDRLIEMVISSDGGSTAGAVNIGLYLTGDLHAGAVVDVDLFASALTISTAIHRTACLVESAVIQHEDGGKTLWALAAVGAASYTVDPQVRFDVVMVPSTSFTDAVSIITLEAYYTAGD